MTATRHHTMIDGKKYVVVLAAGKPAYVRSVRLQDDGTEVEAFLSNRQHKAEARAKSAFTNLIKMHDAKVWAEREAAE